MRYHGIVAVVALVLAGSVSAYPGSFFIFPTIPGGSDAAPVSEFRIRTAAFQPQEIMADLRFVKALTIETSTAVEGPLLISEEPGGAPAFSLSTPQEIQDALVKAMVFFWAPDAETLEIWHKHSTNDPVPLTATRVTGIKPNEEGDVLWHVTLTTFSDLYVVQQPRPARPFPLVPVLIIALASLSSCVLLRRQ